MATIYNLNRARKKREKIEKEEMAERNRLLHGRTGPERERAKKASRAAAAHVDGHFLDPKRAEIAPDSEDEKGEQEPDIGS